MFIQTYMLHDPNMGYGKDHGVIVKVLYKQLNTTHAKVCKKKKKSSSILNTKYITIMSVNFSIKEVLTNTTPMSTLVGHTHVSEILY